MLYVQVLVVCPNWVTVTSCPATVSVPVRLVVAVLAAAEKVALPSPVPLPPPVIVSHPTLLAALQPQPPPAVTPTSPVPPEAANENDVGLATYEHA